jgi:NADP-dependent 3-hydroxy acid dehydrogenase YdfG
VQRNVLTNDRVWLITGASSGFGRAIAEAALSRGDSVVATARRTDVLTDLAANERAHVVSLDVTDAAQRTAAVSETLERFGRIDVLVNNAGRTQVGAIEETTDEELRALSSCTSSLPRRSLARFCRTCGSAAAARSCRCRAWAGR